MREDWRNRLEGSSLLLYTELALMPLKNMMYRVLDSYS